MKKIILLLAILSGVHFVNAQTSTTRGSASINLQKAEAITEQQPAEKDRIVNDSLRAEVIGTENTDLSHNKKAFTELEFESWSVYYTMMANDNMQYNASSSAPAAGKRVSRKYAKAAYVIEPE